VGDHGDTPLEPSEAQVLVVIPIKMIRRTFLTAAIAAPLFAQLKPFRIFIQREERWQDLMDLSNCILGKLYVVQEFPSIGPPAENPVGSTLELPWRNNLNDISRIPAGAYHAKTRADGHLGWRIQLEPETGRELVEIHIGNFPKNSIGCILLGNGRSASDGCSVLGSGAAMKDLKSRYGSTERPIEIVIKNA
jgi:hypothetical protein